jgi:hypothetical protein
MPQEYTPSGSPIAYTVPAYADVVDGPTAFKSFADDVYTGLAAKYDIVNADTSTFFTVGRYSAGFPVAIINGSGAAPPILEFQISGAAVVDIAPSGLLTGFGISLGAWTAWTPALTGTGWALGNGTVAGVYCRTGKTVHTRMLITFGSTSTFGSTALNVSLPVTAASQRCTLDCSADDVSAGVHYLMTGAVALGSAVILNALQSAVGLTEAVISTKPFTWASGDFIVINGTYEAA